MNARVAFLTGVAMLCFAANSLLCRLALAPGLIDPASFVSLRILSACVVLGAVVWLRRRHLPRLRYASLRSTAALFGYLAFFSFAYDRLTTGTGALILIAAVQVTMFVIALREGERFPPLSWLGLAIAVAGLVYLVLPGVSAPDPLGAALMIVSGVSWGFFTLLARGADHPVEVNASNFLCCLVPAALVELVHLDAVHATPMGIGLAVLSGGGATGLSYIAWYMAVRALPATRAAIVQLSVPVLAAVGGVIFLAEPVSLRLLVASAAMLSGIAIVLTQRPIAPRR